MLGLAGGRAWREDGSIRIALSGLRAASRAGRPVVPVARHAPRPDRILCSTALRARQTLAALEPKLSRPLPPIALEKGLYLASEDSLLARLQEIEDRYGTALLVGHNDGIWQLAVMLAGDGRPGALKALQDKLERARKAKGSAP